MTEELQKPKLEGTYFIIGPIAKYEITTGDILDYLWRRYKYWRSIRKAKAERERKRT